MSINVNNQPQSFSVHNSIKQTNPNTLADSTASAQTAKTINKLHETVTQLQSKAGTSTAGVGLSSALSDAEGLMHSNGMGQLSDELIANHQQYKNGTMPGDVYLAKTLGALHKHTNGVLGKEYTGDTSDTPVGGKTGTPALFSLNSGIPTAIDTLSSQASSYAVNGTSDFDLSTIPTGNILIAALMAFLTLSDSVANLVSTDTNLVSANKQNINYLSNATTAWNNIQTLLPATYTTVIPGTPGSPEIPAKQAVQGQDELRVQYNSNSQTASIVDVTTGKSYLISINPTTGQLVPSSIIDSFGNNISVSDLLTSAAVKIHRSVTIVSGDLVPTTVYTYSFQTSTPNDEVNYTQAGVTPEPYVPEKPAVAPTAASTKTETLNSLSDVFNFYMTANAGDNPIYNDDKSGTLAANLNNFNQAASYFQGIIDPATGNSYWSEIQSNLATGSDVVSGGVVQSMNSTAEGLFNSMISSSFSEMNTVLSQVSTGSTVALFSMTPDSTGTGSSYAASSSNVTQLNSTLKQAATNAAQVSSQLETTLQADTASYQQMLSGSENMLSTFKAINQSIFVQ